MLRCRGNLSNPLPKKSTEHQKRYTILEANYYYLSSCQNITEANLGLSAMTYVYIYIFPNSMHLEKLDV